MTDKLRYTPEKLSSKSLETIASEVERELYRISNLLNILTEGFFPITYVAPTKPQVGMVRLADGTQWNPGAGAGVYTYYNGAWNRLG